LGLRALSTTLPVTNPADYLRGCNLLATEAVGKLAQVLYRTPHSERRDARQPRTSGKLAHSWRYCPAKESVAIRRRPSFVGRNGANLNMATH
jgi:hypothetical protein